MPAEPLTVQGINARKTKQHTPQRCGGSEKDNPASRSYAWREAETLATCALYAVKDIAIGHAVLVPKGTGIHRIISCAGHVKPATGNARQKYACWVAIAPAVEMT